MPQSTGFLALPSRYSSSSNLMDLSHEVQVMVKPFSYEPQDIDVNVIKGAVADGSLINYIWSCTWYFHEKFWFLGYQQDRETTTYLMDWLTINTSLPPSAKRLLKISSQQDVERVLCTFGILANIDWQPELMLAKDGQKALDFQQFMMQAHQLLLSVNKNGKLPARELLQQSLDSLPKLLLAEDLPSQQSGLELGMIPPPLDHPDQAHLKAIQATSFTHSEAIMAPEGSTGQSTAKHAASSSTFRAITEAEPSSSDGHHTQDQAIALLQQQVAQLTHQNHHLAEQLKASPGTTSQQKLLQEDQHEINLALLQVIKQASDAKSKDPTEKILKQWEIKIIPSSVVQKIIKLNDYPTNTYTQKAIVTAAQTLLQIYESHREEEDYHDPYDPDALPPQIKFTSHFYTMATSASEALKMLMGTQAFPKHEKPYLQERRKVLQAVMGADLTQAELKNAYQEEGGQGKGKGKDKQKQKKKNKNKQNQGQDRGQNQRRFQDRGRSPSPTRQEGPRSGSPTQKTDGK